MGGLIAADSNSAMRGARFRGWRCADPRLFSATPIRGAWRYNVGTSRCHAPLVHPRGMHPWVSSPDYDEYRLWRKNYGQTILSPNTTNFPLANGHTHHSQGQRPWNTNPTALIWPTAIVKLQVRCTIMPQSLSQRYAHWIFSTRDRFPFPKDHLRERVHSDLATSLRDMGSPFKP